MNRRWRLSRMMMWTGTLCVVAFTSLWIASYWWSCWFESSLGLDIGIGGGVFGAGAGNFGTPRDLGWHLEPRETPMAWWPEIGGMFGSSYRWISVPLWIPFALAMAIGAWGWWIARVDRRKKLGACRNCGYDRAGIGANVPCPECGATA